MINKFSILSVLGTFLLLSTLPPAQATTPSTPNTTPAGAGTILGTLEGAISFCTKIDAQSVPLYKHIDEVFIDGQSSKEIWQVRYSDAYETAYGKTTKILKALTHDQALSTCKAH